MKRLIGLILLVAGVLYPFVVYFGLGHFKPWQLGLVLAAMWLARGLTGEHSPARLGIAASATAFCLLLAWLNDPHWLRWYPVLISAFMLALFASSLVFGQPLAERLARLREPDLPAVAIAYTRKVTEVWCLFFLGNGLVAGALTLWAPLSWWTLYTGLIAYGLMATLFASEWIIRQRVRGRA